MCLLTRDSRATYGPPGEEESIYQKLHGAIAVPHLVPRRSS